MVGASGLASIMRVRAGLLVKFYMFLVEYIRLIRFGI